MTTYAVATLRMKDPESMAAYREKAAEALARHGGNIVQASTDLSLIEGTGPLPDGIAVLSFPDREAAHAWISDPDLTETHALRTTGADTQITLL
ncbi:DUF1330 domain-containing protein [uncultured Roseobacter sp.]|uniref:DUF1330 domain-containing protein n=1 Tax=uncultured Roseobacter sp. TaxID=114847 RepID=UPI002622D941|nr:DUF1330 domain-containing protein [uncultured Roseobacter sp.]